MGSHTKDRLKQFIDFKGLSNRKFSEKIGASPTYFTTTKTIGSDFLEKISQGFSELNMDWVITGRGEMIYLEASENAANDEAALIKIIDNRIDQKAAAFKKNDNVDAPGN